MYLYCRSEADALALEIQLIALWGRHDNGTGVLANLSDGGEGPAGYKMPREIVEKVAAALRGRKLSPGHVAKVAASEKAFAGG